MASVMLQAHAILEHKLQIALDVCVPLKMPDIAKRIIA